MIKAVLLDLSGVLYVGDQAIAGAIDSIYRLRESNIPHTYITNTTRRSQLSIQQSLNKLGFNIALDEIFTAANATFDYLQAHRLRPHVLVHAGLREMFSVLPQNNPNAVVLGDAAEDFTYDNLNRAFRILMQDDTTPLISMGYNRYFMETDGLSLDLGAFTSALEFASGKKAIIMGKPSKDFFLQAVNKLQCSADQVLMIGDDVESDINGALNAGLQACLVKTGKYRPGDENKISSKNVLLAENINDVVNDLLQQAHR